MMVLYMKCLTEAYIAAFLVLHSKGFSSGFYLNWLCKKIWWSAIESCRMNFGFCGRMWRIYCWHTVHNTIRTEHTHNTDTICCKEAWKECAWVGGELLPSQGEMISKSVW